VSAAIDALMARHSAEASIQAAGAEVKQHIATGK
jgi:hypothetical protein